MGRVKLTFILIQLSEMHGAGRVIKTAIVQCIKSTKCFSNTELENNDMTKKMSIVKKYFDADVHLTWHMLVPSFTMFTQLYRIIWGEQKLPPLIACLVRS